MRILHFFKTYWPDTFGGIERTIHAIATGTSKLGFETDVLSLSRDPVAATMMFDGHMAYKAKLNLHIASTGLSLDVVGKFSDLCQQADLVHYHFPWPMMDLVHFASRTRKPTILTYHSDIVKQRTMSLFYSPLMHRFLGSVDQIVATSPNYLASSSVLERYRQKTSVIPLGLAASNYPTPADAIVSRLTDRFRKPFFLFVGVLRYYKGIHTLLEAAKITGLEVVIAGAGPTESQLKAQAKADGLFNVHFVGPVNEEEKIALLDLSLGLVFPSPLRSEAFGLSLVEAAMRGKPMISCEIGTGTSFVNLDGETGYVVRPDDATGLGDAMRKIADDSGLAAKFGNAARHRFDNFLTAETMANSYAELYRTVVNR
jgi:glycosyltransferase involved in cell wall biosynthesis